MHAFVGIINGRLSICNGQNAVNSLLQSCRLAYTSEHGCSRFVGLRLLPDLAFLAGAA